MTREDCRASATPAAPTAANYLVLADQASSASSVGSALSAKGATVTSVALRHEPLRATYGGAQRFKRSSPARFRWVSMVNNKAFGMVQEALADAEVAELARPTLDDGESYHQLLADPSSFETYDIDAARTKGYGFARIQRYALERLIGAPDPMANQRNGGHHPPKQFQN